MKVTKSNKELLLLLQKDDRVAFYNLYERYSKRLYYFVLQYLKFDADAEEIVQEVFIKIWEKRKTIVAYSSFESFLFTVAYNATISLLRKRVTEKKYLVHLQSIQQADETNESIDNLYYNELNDKLKSLLNQLTPRQKEIFRLSREDGLTHEQISQKLNISINTVKKHVANTISFLKSNLDNELAVSVFFVYMFVL